MSLTSALSRTRETEQDAMSRSQALSEQSAAAPALLELSGVTKRFGGVRALVDMHLSVRRGEVMALVGENGAGKSTLVKILTGIHRPDAGEIRLGGASVALASPLAAMRAGITAVHQETVMFD